MGLIAICTTAAVAGIALQTSIQTHNCIQNWTKDAHTVWTTQAQVNEEVQDEIQEIKTAIQWVRYQLMDLQKQVMLNVTGILLNFVLPLFGSIIVPTLGNK